MNEKTDINKVYKLNTFKRLNAPATIFGFPYGIFFIVISWLIINMFLIMSVNYAVKIIIVIIALAGLVGITVVYKKYGIKATSKFIISLLEKVEVVKMNEQINIKKLNLKNKGE